MCLILLKVEESAFTQASFLSLFDIHMCSGDLQMALSSLGKQTADCESSHNWLMSLSMDLAALCDIWRWKWHQCNKPEPNMLKIVPIIPSRTSQKSYPVFFSCSQIITYYSQIINNYSLRFIVSDIEIQWNTDLINILL